MTLIQPEKRLIIWESSYSKGVALHELDSSYNIDKLIADAPYSDVRQGFAWYANNDYIEPKGWKQVNQQFDEFEEIFNSNYKDYYGSL